MFGWWKLSSSKISAFPGTVDNCCGRIRILRMTLTLGCLQESLEKINKLKREPSSRSSAALTKAASGRSDTTNISTSTSSKSLASTEPLPSSHSPSGVLRAPSRSSAAVPSEAARGANPGTESGSEAALRARSQSGAGTGDAAGRAAAAGASAGTVTVSWRQRARHRWSSAVLTVTAALRFRSAGERRRERRRSAGN